jgi:hypothetical protein
MSKGALQPAWLAAELKNARIVLANRLSSKAIACFVTMHGLIAT